MKLRQIADSTTFILLKWNDSPSMEKTENGECRGMERIVMGTHIYSNSDAMHLSHSHSS